MKLFVLIAVAASPFLAAPAAAASAPVEPAQRYCRAASSRRHPGIVRELLQASSREAAERAAIDRSIDDDRCLGDRVPQSSNMSPRP